MAKKKKSTKNKKRVAVHIRENIKGKREAAASADGEVGADKRAPLLAAPLGVGKPKRPREPADAASLGKAKDDPARKEKERTDANNYLVAWLTVRKEKEAAEEAGVAPPPATGVWKFNKNTQAWLLRHVFSDDEIDDKRFETLCLYLEGLKGAGRQRVLAAAQAIIDKHGPDEGKEQTAAEREAAAAEVATADDEIVTNETAAVVPSGYNSDSTDDDEEDNDGGAVAGARQTGGEGGVAAPPPAAARTGNAGEFSFGFFDGTAEEATSKTAAKEESDSDGSSSSSDDEEGGDGGGAVEALAPATKKPRKARSALTGKSKAEAKAKAAAVAYERALQVAEVLA
ncbi:unnamed protein product [Ectocarpus sp. 8 AP-2014]